MIKIVTKFIKVITIILCCSSAVKSQKIDTTGLLKEVPFEDVYNLPRFDTANLATVFSNINKVSPMGMKICNKGEVWKYWCSVLNDTNLLKNSAVLVLKHPWQKESDTAFTLKKDIVKSYIKKYLPLNGKKQDITNIKSSIRLNKAYIDTLLLLLTNDLNNISSRITDALRPSSNIINSSQLIEEKIGLNDKIDSALDIKRKLNELDSVIANINTTFHYIEDTSSTEHYFLHKENNLWSEYLLGIKEILVVIISNDPKLLNTTISSKDSLSYLISSGKDLIDLTKLLTLGGVVQTIDVHYISTRVKNRNIPTELTFANKGLKKDLVIPIHEKNHFNFQVGVSRFYLNRNDFKIENKQLVISPSDSSKKDWKSSLIGSFVYYPFGQDIDRMSNIWSRDSLHSLPYHIFQRLGVFAGLKISADPFQEFSYGVNYSFFKGINLIAGYNNVNQIVPSIAKVGDINSIGDALKYANRKYKSQFFWGISVAPIQMIKALGLKKK